MPEATSAEAGLWTLSARAEVDARQSAELNRDSELNAYVRNVACKVAATYCDEMRIYVMDRPFFNASMAPNGYMEVWSGLLLRARNEAELAFVLGHEIGHYAHSHSWRSFLDQKARADGAMIASLLISAAGVVAMANAGSAASVQNISNATQGLVSAVYLGSVAGMFTFSRENEHAADAYGHSAVVSAGYHASAPGDIWKRLRQETAASDFKRIRESDTRTSIFDSHPLVVERIDMLEKLSSGAPKDGVTEEQRYRAIVRPHLASWLKDELRRRDFGQTLFLLDEIDNGEDLGVINFFRGECHRLRRADGYQAAAEAAYRSAIAHPDVPAAAYRELADLAEKKGSKSEMADLLISYLERDPAARDAAFVKMRITQVRPLPAPPETSSPVQPAPAIAPAEEPAAVPNLPAEAQP